jgi:probable phosphoglycerate mutase
MAILILVRHGETLWNRFHRIQGQLDSDLSPQGRAQARALAAHLAGAGAVRLVSSDLGRTVDTARPVADVTGLPLETHEGLRERAFGVFQGLTPDEIATAHPADFERWRDREPEHVVPGGESLAGFRARVRGALEELAAGQGPVIVITHGGVLDAAYRIAQGIGDRDKRAWPLQNASVNRIEVGPMGWRVQEWGDVSHLADGSADEH